jgi:hypothetical protein
MSLTTDQLKEYSQGNFGALSFLLTLCDYPKSQTILDTLEKATTIRAANIWVLYLDLAGKNMAVLEKLCLNTPIEILEDACSREDYSGLQLVKEYK